jgi:hypothetical protein
MIKFLADIIDQLDLALDQLALDERNFDRFAVILIDNVAELLLHRYALDKAEDHRNRAAYGTSPYDPKKLQKALGRGFDDKAKFASKQGLISQETCESIVSLHGFRNTSYHQGLRHEGILHSLAIAYFRIVCDLLENYNPPFYEFSSSKDLPYRARKYLGNLSYSGNRDNFSTAYRRLDDLAASLEKSLVTDLATDMNNSIKAADSDLHLIAGSDQKEKRDWAVVFAQAFIFNQSDDASEKAKELGFKDSDGKNLFDWLMDEHRWNISHDPIPSWQSRLDRLTQEADVHKAIKKYCEFRCQTTEIRLTLEEVASEIDYFIEMQAEIERGK